MYRSIFIVLLAISMFWSCRNNTESTQKIISCAYLPKDNTLQNLDSLIRLNDEHFMDSLVKKYKNKDIESRVFLYSKLVKKYTNVYKLTKAKQLIKTLDSLLMHHDLQVEPLKAEYFTAKAIYLSYNYQLDSAMVYYNKAINIYNNLDEKVCKELLYCYKDVSVAHFYFGGIIDSARLYLEKQEMYFNSSFIDHNLMYNNYYIQANIHKRLHNYSLGMSYVDLALKELEKYTYPDSNGYSVTYSLKAEIEYQYNMYKQSIEDSKRAISFLNNKNTIVKKHLYIGIINVLSAMDSVELSYKYIDTLYHIDEDDIITKALTYKLKATIEMNDDKRLESEKDFKKAIELYKSVELNDSYLYAETCYLYGQLLGELGKYTEATKYIKKAIYTHFDTISMSFNILSKDPKSILYTSGLAEINSKKYLISNKIADKIATIGLFKLIDNLIVYSYNNFDDDVIISNQSKLDYYYEDKLNFYYNTYSKSKNPSDLDEIVEIFNDYKGKALLKERLLNNTNLGVNDSIIALKRKVDEIKYNIEEKNGDSDSLNFTLNQVLVKLEFYSNRSIFNLSSKENKELLNKIERFCLEKNTIVLDYFLPDKIDLKDAGYIFISNGLSSDIIQITGIKAIKEQSDSLFNLYSAYSEDTASINKLSIELYQKLLFFIDGYKTENLESIIVIPDQDLCKIPFGLLRSKKNRLLLTEYNVSYGYSIQNLLLSEKKRVDKGKILVFAHSDPNTILSESGDSLSEIPGSYREVKEIQKIYKDRSTCFTGFRASKENFIINANDYPIIHLALHGKSDDNSRFKSKIYFRNDKTLSELYPHELMKYRISPDLLVLSACETAKGKLLEHESMYSVARAFYAGGAKKVISSLWELDDQSSNQILKEFYTLISQNDTVTYSQALRIAKLKYLKKVKSSNKYNSFIGSLVLYN